MGFIDCIQGHIDGNRISKQKGRELQNQFDALKKQYTDSGQDAGAAAKAANDIIAVEAQKSAQRRQNILTQAQKIAEVMDEFDAMDGPITKKISDFFQRTYYRAQQIEASMLKHLNDVSKHLAPSFFETSRDYAAIKKGIRSILEGNAEGDDVGRAFKQVFDTIHSRYKAAGGIIGKLENYFPQMHSKDLVRQTSADEWVDFISPLLNREKMIDPATSMPFTDARLREVLLESHERIVTNGASDLKKRLKSGEAMTQGRKTDLDERRDVSRFLHFKDADSFFEYNNRFGVGDEGLPGALLGHIRGMSKDLAVMETMGPKSDSMMKRFEDGMRAEGITGVKAGWVKGQYQVVKGFNGGSVENKPWMMILSGVQNWLRSAMLGAASISAISDSAFIAATSKINGLSTTRAMNNYLKLMGGNKNLKDIAKRSGFIADVVNGSVIADARLATTMHEGGKAQGRGANFANAAAKFQNMTGWLAGLTNKFSGLARMTQATQDAIAIEGMATLADNFGRAFGDLDSDLSRNLKQFGISPEDWEIIRKTQALDSGRGAKFFNTDDLRVREDLDPREAAKLANKVDDWIISLRSLASNEGNVRTKAVTSGAFLGNAGRGTGSWNQLLHVQDLPNLSDDEPHDSSLQAWQGAWQVGPHDDDHNRCWCNRWDGHSAQRDQQGKATQRSQCKVCHGRSVSGWWLWFVW